LPGHAKSGKTTLVRAEFSNYAYASLELPDQRSFALEDPRGFLAQFRGPVVLDEAQRAPELFSYIQSVVGAEYPQPKSLNAEGVARPVAATKG
jgi:predicted AAA+ superfamily ATPase